MLLATLLALCAAAWGQGKIMTARHILYNFSNRDKTVS